ncbi:MAG: hypothetical protein JRI79_05980 [Deltaproteobacteria bacterium]|nr:hypothetical protein [Deltaproteobacteria bacterium]MBW1977502.1 hypothetical protein [Deltaproteobacteria bacterium]MBW2043931.1 hypothetical protein [Deltaproteobacteria bacterium]
MRHKSETEINPSLRSSRMVAEKNIEDRGAAVELKKEKGRASPGSASGGGLG